MSSQKIAYNAILYNDYELEKAIEDINKAGYDGVELFPKQINCENVSIGELERTKDLIRANNLDLACLMVGSLEDERSLRYIKEACDICQILGCKYIFVLPPQKGQS